MVEAPNISSLPPASPQDKLHTVRFISSYPTVLLKYRSGQFTLKISPHCALSGSEEQVTHLPGPGELWVSCPVPHLIWDSHLIPDCCTPRCWFLALILSHLSPQGNAHLQLCSVSVFWISSAPEWVCQEPNSSTFWEMHYLKSRHQGTAIVARLQGICKASANRYNSPAGQRSHLSFFSNGWSGFILL